MLIIHCIVFVVYNKRIGLSNDFFARSTQKNRIFIGSVFIFSISFSFVVFYQKNIQFFTIFTKKILLFSHDMI